MVLSNEEPIMGDTAYGNVRNGTVCADLLVWPLWNHRQRGSSTCFTWQHSCRLLEALPLRLWIRWRNDAQCILMHFVLLFHLFWLVGRVSSRIWSYPQHAGVRREGGDRVPLGSFTNERSTYHWGLKIDFPKAPTGNWVIFAQEYQELQLSGGHHVERTQNLHMDCLTVIYYIPIKCWYTGIPLYTHNMFLR